MAGLGAARVFGSHVRSHGIDYLVLLNWDRATFTSEVCFYSSCLTVQSESTLWCICLPQRRGVAITFASSFVPVHLHPALCRSTIPPRVSHADHAFPFTCNVSRHGAFQDLTWSAIVASSQLYFYAFNDHRHLDVGATPGHHYRTTSDWTCLC
jgi:hypothetical protein